jgi:hypothetical protein
LQNSTSFLGERKEERKNVKKAFASRVFLCNVYSNWCGEEKEKQREEKLQETAFFKEN